MDLPPRGNNPKILTERAPEAKVERPPAIVRDDATGLFDEERPRRVVLRRGGNTYIHKMVFKNIYKSETRRTHPDFFLISTTTTTTTTIAILAESDGQAQVDAAARVATHERGIFSLRIHAHGLRAHAEARRDERVGVERRVCPFVRFEKGEVVRRQTRHAQSQPLPPLRLLLLLRVGGTGTGCAGRGCGRVERELVRALPADGDEQRASILCFGVFSIGGIGALKGWRWGWVGREVRTAYDAQLDARIDEERETNGVLSAAQEPLRPIDRIQRPKS